MGKHDKVYGAKYKGKWAVYVNGRPVFADLSKSQLAYHIKKANENITLYGRWLDKSKWLCNTGIIKLKVTIMNLRQAIANIDLNHPERPSLLPFDQLYANVLYQHDVPDGMWAYDTFDLKQYKIKTWVCTDTEVGLYAYFLRNEFAFITSQTSRKSDIEFFWDSKVMHTKVSNYLRSFITQEYMYFIELNDTIYDINIDNYGRQWLDNGGQ